MECPECEYENETGRAICDMCGAQLPGREGNITYDTDEAVSGAPSGSDPTNSAGGRSDRKETGRGDRITTGERHSGRRITQLYRYHPIAGAGILFCLMTFTGFPSSLSLPNLFMNLGASVLVGAPMGFLISYIGGGFFVGALISMMVFAGLDLSMLFVKGATDSILVVPILMQALMWGWIPGCLIGVHVNQDMV